jgi:hypothetical protein
MTRHRQKTLIGGAEPESFGKQIRRGTTLQNRKLLPWLVWTAVRETKGKPLRKCKKQNAVSTNAFSSFVTSSSEAEFRMGQGAIVRS